jgi:hypothetical protein
LCCERPDLITTKQNGMNTLAYILYILTTYIITVHVGLIFFRNGRLYILRLLHGDENLTDSINRILLTGYYLLNLGYAALMIRGWKTILTWTDLLASLTTMTGRIIITLGIIHFFNMAVIYLISRRHQPITNNKNLEA